MDTTLIGWIYWTPVVVSMLGFVAWYIWWAPADVEDDIGLAWTICTIFWPILVLAIPPGALALGVCWGIETLRERRLKTE